MSRMDEMEARLESRLDEIDRQLADRMAALDAGLGTAASVGNPKDASTCAESVGERSVARRAAVCVGLRKVAYNDSLATLPGCPIDADRFACALETMKYPNGSVAVLKDENATCRAVYTAIHEAATVLQPGDLFVLLVSGHGGKEAWCLYDGRATNREIVWMLSRFRKGVRILIVNDQCHSGAFFMPTRDDAGSPLETICRDGGCDDSWDPSAAWNSPDFPMVMQFASCRAEQQSADGLAGGSWTQALIDALHQKLCVEGRRCSYGEWFDAAKVSPLLVHGVQDPECIESPNVAEAFRNAPALT